MSYFKYSYIFIFILFPSFVNADLNKELIKIININHEVIEFNVEIADDENERTKGLMWRTDLDDNEGMLFIWDESKIRNFWMKNTPLSLDIIFIDKYKKIVKIQENTEPFSENIISSEISSKYVLEILGGKCKELKINVGDMIKFF